MASYRVCYCDAKGNVFSTDDVEAANDAGAMARARALVNSRAALFEVWQGDRLIHRSGGDRPPLVGRFPPG
jgi:hypothetical protein